jgi:hypothetical protein
MQVQKRNLFDEIARLIALPVSRRQVFKYLVTGVAGAALYRFGLSEGKATAAAPHCRFGTGECCTFGNIGPCDPTDGMCANNVAGWRRIPNHFCPADSA